MAEFDHNRYYLDQYVGDQQGIAIDSNTCDYKGTSKFELDRIKEDAHRQNARFVEKLKTINHDERVRLRRFAELHEKKMDAARELRSYRIHGIDHYCQFSLSAGPDPERPWEQLRVYFVGPRWMAYYDVYQSYKRIMFEVAPPAGYAPMGA